MTQGKQPTLRAVPAAYAKGERQCDAPLPRMAKVPLQVIAVTDSALAWVRGHTRWWIPSPRPPPDPVIDNVDGRIL